MTMRTAFLDAVSVEDVQKIARWLVALAQAHDMAAAKIVLSYVIGRPPKTTGEGAVDDEEEGEDMADLPLRDVDRDAVSRLRDSDIDACKLWLHFSDPRAWRMSSEEQAHTLAGLERRHGKLRLPKAAADEEE